MEEYWILVKSQLGESEIRCGTGFALPPNPPNLCSCFLAAQPPSPKGMCRHKELCSICDYEALSNFQIPRGMVVNTD